MPRYNAGMNPNARWDIFCTVVDNYGDIGVCWRLARQLVAEHGLSVRLWVDDLASFAKLAPALDPQRAQQAIHGVDIRHWSEPFPQTAVADVVIEAFACSLPAAYLNAMAQREAPPSWVNLEYLSAESWVDELHGLASPHPHLPLTKHFFFPGMTSQTGGVLREAHLLASRDAFQSDARAQVAWWQRHGLTPPPDALKISLFAYPSTPVPEWIDACTRSPQPIYCVVPDTPFAHAAGLSPLAPGQLKQRGKLTLAGIPFLPQAEYDRLLWACDLNFVRGEDSFVRALWAGKPLVWQIYPQQDSAHQAKLDAFLFLYQNITNAPQSISQFWQAWNGTGSVRDTWTGFNHHLIEFKACAPLWANWQAQSTDLATNLVNFCKKPL